MKKLFWLFIIIYFMHFFFFPISKSCLTYQIDDGVLVLTNLCHHEVIYQGNIFIDPFYEGYVQVRLGDDVFLFDEFDRFSKPIIKGKLHAFEKISFPLSFSFLNHHRCQILQKDLSIFEIKEESLSLKRPKTMWFGDSLMSSIFGKSFAAFFHDFMNSSFFDYSFSGSVISSNVKVSSGTLPNDFYIPQVVNQVLDTTNFIPDVIFFNGGVNDIIGYYRKWIVSKEDSIDSLINELEKMILQLKIIYPYTQLVYVNLFDYRVDGLLNYMMKTDGFVDRSSFAYLRKKSVAYFSEVKKLMERYGFVYLDLSYLLRKDLLMDDGLHLKKEAYELLVLELLQRLKKHVWY